jgi:hypothetical protein
MKTVLELLEQYNVATTFFSQGKIVLEYPDVIQSIVAQGHAYSRTCLRSQDFWIQKPRRRSYEDPCEYHGTDRGAIR